MNSWRWHSPTSVVLTCMLLWIDICLQNYLTNSTRSTARMLWHSWRRAATDRKVQDGSRKVTAGRWLQSLGIAEDTATEPSSGMSRMIREVLVVETISACWERPEEFMSLWRYWLRLHWWAQGESRFRLDGPTHRTRRVGRSQFCVVSFSGTAQCVVTPRKESHSVSYWEKCDVGRPTSSDGGHEAPQAWPYHARHVTAVLLEDLVTTNFLLKLTGSSSTGEKRQWCETEHKWRDPGRQCSLQEANCFDRRTLTNQQDTTEKTDSSTL